MFTVKNGKPLLLTECIDVNSLKVKHLDGADGTFSGELKAAKGTFSGTISANGAKIGGFTIDNGSLNWKGRDFSAMIAGVYGLVFLRMITVV